MAVRHIEKSSGAAKSYTGNHAGIGVDEDDNKLYYNPDGTRVAVTAANQDLNTTDDVQFRALTLTGDLETDSDIDLVDGSLNIWQDSAIRVELVEDSGLFTDLLSTLGGRVRLGNGGYTIDMLADALEMGSKPVYFFGETAWLRFDTGPDTLSLATEPASNVPIDLAPDGDLNINGTPGLTSEIVLTGLGTLSVTKGIITAWTPV